MNGPGDSNVNPPVRLIPELDIGPRVAENPRAPAIRPHAIGGDGEDSLFRLLLTSDGHDVGWLGWDSNHWAVLVSDPNQAVALRRYVENGRTYYCVGDETSGAWWLSVSNNGYVGFYGWNDSVDWTWDGDTLKCSHDGGHLSYDPGANPPWVKTNGSQILKTKRSILNMFRMKLASSDGRDLGWLGWNSNHWAVLVSDRNQAQPLRPYVLNDNRTYYCVGDDTHNAWWLSVSNNHDVGFYGYNDATAWAWYGQTLKSNFDGGHLSYDPGANPAFLKTNGKEVFGVTQKSAYEGPIKHLFVLMLENRSFDHMLGFSGISGIDAVTKEKRSINGLRGDESNQSGGKNYKVSKPANWTMTEDPGHEFQNVLKQLCGEGAKYSSGAPYPSADNSGFAADYAAVPKTKDPGEVLKCYDAGQNPALVALAREFAVCDNWFASMPGPTWPNRYFAHAASSGGLDDSPTQWQIVGWSMPGAEGFKFEHGAIFGAASLDWDIYVHDLLCNNCGSISGVSQRLMGLYPDLASNLKNGRTAQYTFIEPNYGDVGGDYSGGNSQHPVDDVRKGDQLIADVYSTIRNSPYWESSMLIITWDEHGGFYDHVHPPKAPLPGDRGVMKDVNKWGFTFDHYGVRVPAVVVSPLIPKGVIDGRLYDHSSIPATVEKLFGVAPLTTRDEKANSLDTLVTLTTPRKDCPLNVPTVMAHELNVPFPDAREPRLAAAEIAIKREQPIESVGNLPGFVYSAMRMQVELSPKEQHDAIVARVGGLRTVGEGKDYIEEVRRIVSGGAASAR